MPRSPTRPSHQEAAQVSQEGYVADEELARGQEEPGVGRRRHRDQPEDRVGPHGPDRRLHGDEAEEDAREADDALVAQAEAAQQRRGRQHRPRDRVERVAGHAQEQDEPEQLEAAQAPLQHRTDAGKGDHVEHQVHQAAVEEKGRQDAPDCGQRRVESQTSSRQVDHVDRQCMQACACKHVYNNNNTIPLAYVAFSRRSLSRSRTRGPACHGLPGC